MTPSLPSPPRGGGKGGGNCEPKAKQSRVRGQPIGFMEALQQACYTCRPLRTHKVCPMLDRSHQGEDQVQQRRVPADFQEHLANLEAAGLLVRIDRAVNKDSELHPLVRWQFQGGLEESERRAFLFTNVVGADGGPFEMTVACG